MLKAQKGKGWAKIYILERRFCTLCFDELESRKFELLVKHKATGRPIVVYFIYSQPPLNMVMFIGSRLILYSTLA